MSRQEQGASKKFHVNIPIVVKQMSKVLGVHHNFHPDEEKLKLTEFVQYQIPLVGGLKNFVLKWEK